MCDVLLIVEELLIPFNTLAESEEIMKFCSESIFSIISSVSAIASASAVNVDAILDILNFLLIASLISIDANPTVACYATEYTVQFV
jgi:hypothetical protein